MKTFIFDFDGTIADSVKIAFDIIRIHASELGCKQLEEPDLPLIRSMSTRQLLTYLNIPLWRIPAFILSMRQLMKQQMMNLKVFPHMSETLLELKQRGIILGILTTNSLENVQVFLKNNQLDTTFDFIDTESHLFKKAHRLKKLIKKHNISVTNTYYIGDETRDIEAAKACNIHAVAVSWGLGSAELLAQHHPDTLATTASELLQL
jgi:phosphoglycolate phosphatase